MARPVRPGHFYARLPSEIRKVIYTTNAIESVNMSLRKLTKNRSSFPSDEALMKLFYLALKNISQNRPCPSAIGGLPSRALPSSSGSGFPSIN